MIKLVKVFNFYKIILKIFKKNSAINNIHLFNKNMSFFWKIESLTCPLKNFWKAAVSWLCKGSIIIRFLIEIWNERLNEILTVS
jgi:hypothetical protein